LTRRFLRHWPDSAVRSRGDKIIAAAAAAGARRVRGWRAWWPDVIIRVCARR